MSFNLIRIMRDIGLFHNRQSRLSARCQRAEPALIALLRCPRCHRRAHESRDSRSNSARFGNAPTVRNPTHRAVTNATFTSGCVHGHRAWFCRLCSLVVSTRCSSADLATSLHVPVRRPSPALRSSVSSEGSLLFVVCPSRISTHSVSGETHYRSLLSNPRPLCPSFLVRLFLLLFRRLRRRRLSPCTSSLANESDKTTPSPRVPPRANQNGDGVSRALSVLLASSCAIPPWHPTPWDLSRLMPPFACSQTPLQMQSRVQTMTSRTASFI